MLPSLAAFAVALLAASLLTPVIRGAAQGAGLLDEPDGRKVHEVPLPRLGGVAIAAAFYLGIAAALVVARTGGSPLSLETSLPAILVGAALIAAIGVLDDLQGMRARVKLSAQVVVALVAFGLGLSIDRLDGPWGSIALDAWALPLTVAWCQRFPDQQSLDRTPGDLGGGGRARRLGGAKAGQLRRIRSAVDAGDGVGAGDAEL